jgi:hypothetical protein
VFHQRLANLVGQDECRLVLATEIAAQLERRNALGGIGVNRNRRQVGLERQLVIGKDRPGSYREGVAAI